jgi:hypothetical protein
MAQDMVQSGNIFKVGDELLRSIKWIISFGDVVQILSLTLVMKCGQRG